MKTKALDRAGRERTIILWFAIRIQHDNCKYATSYEIARGLGLSASGKFRAILKGMVSSGQLHQITAGTEEAKRLDSDGLWKERQGRWKGSGYMLANGTYGRPSRSIKVKSKGVQKGQLELL